MVFATAPSARRLCPQPADHRSIAARQIVAAARSLLTDMAVDVDRGRCLAVALAIEDALADPDASACDILSASPFVVERSGRVRTLVEMVEADESQGEERFRLARLLLRAIEWG